MDFGKKKITKQQADAANEFVKEANADADADEWQEDESFFEYRTLSEGEEFEGVYLDVISQPFDCIRFRVQDGDFETIYGLPFYYSLRKFFDNHMVQTGARFRLLNQGLIDLNNGRTMNKIKVMFKKTDPFIKKNPSSQQETDNLNF